jgi:Ca2+/H+ antiporter
MKPSLNWLLAFIPATLALEHTGVPAPWVFFTAALAIVPIASLIVRATEQRC